MGCHRDRGCGRLDTARSRTPDVERGRGAEVGVADNVYVSGNRMTRPGRPSGDEVIVVLQSTQNQESPQLAVGGQLRDQLGIGVGNRVGGL